jgi:hypothetical protein
MKRPRPKGSQIGLLTDPEVLNRYRMYRQPLGLLDYPAVTVQSNNPTRRRKHVATKPKDK